MAGHVHVDTAAVAAAADTMLAQNRALLIEQGSPGAQARLMQACCKAWYLAIAEEMNRGTDPGDLLHAVPSVLSNFLSSFASSLKGEVPAQALAREMIDTLIATTCSALAEPDGRNSRKILVQRGGRA